ncbi:MAG TPA: transketolase C-terminal domain-containing protein [Steroidobacteraceae bacterium]|nr:transketolase C-terminal domain-containing protein [Steroidobacteraceae bacterium]
MSAKPATVNAMQAINLALHDAMKEDDSVIVFGEDLADPEGGGVLGVTKGLSSTFGDSRVRSTPISEQAIIGAGIGAALGGLRPVTEIMLMNFAAVAMDMITNHAAKLRFMSGGQTHVPMTIRTMTGAGAGNGGQHSDYLEAWFAHTAGIKVVTYSSPAEAYGLLLSAIFDEDPVIFIENLTTYFVTGPAPTRGALIPLGKANVLRRGTDISLISYGFMVNHAWAAAVELEKEGVSAEVIDLRTVAPYDAETILDSVGRTGRVVIVHEAVRNFGVGAEIAAEIAEALHGRLKSAPRRVGGSFNAVPFSKPLETSHMPNPARILAAARSALGR